MMGDIQMNLVRKSHHLPLGRGRTFMYQNEIDVGVVAKLGIASRHTADQISGENIVFSAATLSFTAR
jgi:hypothetical protein